MHNLVDVGSFDTDVPVPDDGVDFRTAASLYGAFQALANRTLFLYLLLKGFIIENVSLQGNVFVGAFLQVFGLTQLLGDLTVDGTTALHVTEVTGTLTVSGATSIANSCTVHALEATGIGCSGDISCDGNFFAYGSTHQIGGNVADSLILQATTTANSPVHFQDSIHISANSFCNKLIACTSTGRMARPAVIGPASGGGTLSPTVANHYYFPTVTADQAFVIDSTFAANGDEIHVSTLGTFFVNVFYPDGVTLVDAMLNASGSVNYIFMKYIGGSWYRLNRTIVP